MNENNNSGYSKVENNQEATINLRQIVDTIWSLRYWIVLSVVIALITSYLIIKMTTPMYERKTSILLVNDDGKGNLTGEMALIAEITGSSVSQKIENEMFILKSTPLMLNVVEDLGLNVQYVKVGILRDSELYKNSPIHFEYVKNNNNEAIPNIKLTINIIDYYTYSIESFELNDESVYFENNQFAFDDAIACENGYFTIAKTEYFSAEEYGSLKIKVIDTSKCAREYTKILTAENTGASRAGKGSDIITLTLKDSDPRRAEDILNTLISKYNEDSKTFRTQSVNSTLHFITERLNTIEQELGLVESDITQYRADQSIVNVESQSQLVLSSDVKYEQELIAMETQISLLKMIKDNLNSQQRKYDIIPANIGISDLGLNNTIEQYNLMIIDYNRLLASSSENNPKVVNAGLQLNQMRESIDLTISNLEKSYKIQEKALLAKVDESKRKISDIP
ncbi:hypothetical protein LJC30_06895, partial [Odoribacter sp. OttesenSCG-928-L07]|nr:hypothetical protein [Odoribacter sp. OttesenSCG-928-L07]